MPLPNQDNATIAARRARERAHAALNISTAFEYLRTAIGSEAVDQEDVPFTELLNRLTPMERERYDALLAVDLANAAIRDNQVTDILSETPMPTPTTNEDTPIVPFTIIPTERPEPYEDTVNVDDLDVAVGTPAPERDLVESIRSLGVLQAIAVRGIDQPNGYSVRYEVIEGARRTLAAREVGLTAIPALVFPEDTPRHVIAAMTLSTNSIRRANPLRELESIEALVAAGADETTISRELHIPRQTLQARMRLSRLVPELRAALSDGRIGAAVADLASRLDVNRQGMLVNLLNERAGNSRLMDRRITASDVRTLRQARQASAVSALPDSMFVPAPRIPRVPEPNIQHLRDGVLSIDGTTYYSANELEMELARIRQSRDVIEERLRHQLRGMEVRVRDIDLEQTRLTNEALIEQRDRMNREFAERLASAERRAVETARSMFASATAVANAPTIPAPAPTVTPDATETESWASVHRLLIRAQELTPVAPDPRSEHMYQSLDELIAWAARTVAAQTSAGTAPPSAVPARTTPPALMIRGQYRMFDREDGPSGRHFMRYADTNGRLRRRFMPEAEWNNQRQIAEQRAAALSNEFNNVGA